MNNKLNTFSYFLSYVQCHSGVLSYLTLKISNIEARCSSFRLLFFFFFYIFLYFLYFYVNSHSMGYIVANCFIACTEIRWIAY